MSRLRDMVVDLATYIVGIPIVLLMSLLWLVCKLCGVDLEDDF